ncbi:hypothetical protein GYMLUDRAFT_65188 [Collybiopsis luxurians FD-317 M1]|uniref:Fungal-type protein kinase domain-containing protein n=1 Tax=Collybiopsis luxurians FD-317 M1 TaxID=944289 RepID=A0A0D0AK72_9AGAR|nr:hypothetical protein GYMLUDRAFT_65188 [Collybiopsis luxurians FD-317 M1]
MSKLFTDLYSRIAKEKHYLYLHPGDRWAEFANDPSDSTRSEKSTFTPLADIFTEVVNAAVALDDKLKANFEFKVTGNTHSPEIGTGKLSVARRSAANDGGHSEFENSQMKKAAEKDGCSAGETFKMLELLSEPMIDSIYDFTAPSERYNQNQRKIISDASKFLSSDPARRFTFAFTIEGTALSLWLLHRGALLKGEPFNFFEKFFFAIAFASPEQMGWDSTIVPALVNERGYRAFFIGISGRVYRTLETLSNHSTKNPLGRAVRVWEVEDAHGQQHVLKNLWQETDRDEEQEIHNRILESVLHFAPGLRHLVQDGLFTILAHCHVEVLGQVDHTTNVILRGIDLRKAQTFEVEPQTSASPGSQSIGHSFIENLDIDRRGGFRKTCFQRSCVRASALSHFIRGVRYDTFRRNQSTSYHSRSDEDYESSFNHPLCQWVHRDISVANLYFYQGRGIVGDWEYATSREDSKEHNVRTVCFCFHFTSFH